ncbi:MAG: ComF family protein [Intestinibacillus sp.]
MTATLLQLLYPPRCILCRARLQVGTAAMLCANCAERLRTHYRTAEHVTVEDTDGAAAALLYKGEVRAAMHRYKFAHGKACAGWFAAQLAPVVGAWLDDWQPDCVTYVPISFGRFWERGYNQSELVARRLARQFALPCVPLLQKRAFVARQSDKLKAERKQNVENVFRLRRGVALTGQRVLLVDDVLTTGATLSACARALRQGGAERVFAVAMTKTP